MGLLALGFEVKDGVAGVGGVDDGVVAGRQQGVEGEGAVDLGDEPFGGEGGAGVAEVEGGGAAFGEVDEVFAAGVGEAVAGGDEFRVG